MEVAAAPMQIAGRLSHVAPCHRPEVRIGSLLLARTPARASGKDEPGAGALPDRGGFAQDWRGPGREVNRQDDDIDSCHPS